MVRPRRDRATRLLLGWNLRHRLPISAGYIRHLLRQCARHHNLLAILGIWNDQSGLAADVRRYRRALDDDHARMSGCSPNAASNHFLLLRREDQEEKCFCESVCEIDESAKSRGACVAVEMSVTIHTYSIYIEPQAYASQGADSIKPLERPTKSPRKILHSCRTACQPDTVLGHLIASNGVREEVDVVMHPFKKAQKSNQRRKSE